MDSLLSDELKKLDTFFVCTNTLNGVLENDLDRQIFSHVRSRMVELGYFINDDQDIGQYYAVGLVIKDKDTKILFESESKTYLPKELTLQPNDMVIFVSSVKWKVLSGYAEPYFYKIIEKPVFGKGSKKYRVEIEFFDKYFIDVYSDSENQAIDTAYAIGIDSWTHEWPEGKDKELDRYQNIRVSVWGKSMIKAREYNE